MEGKNILNFKHICPICDVELGLLTTDEIETNVGNLSILTYMCEKCETRLNIIDTEKTYLREIGFHLIENNIAES